MAGPSAIEWTERTWNPIKGCKVLSPGCTNCYAMRLAGTRLKAHPSYAGLTADTKAGPVWTGEMRLDPKALKEPLRWRKPAVIFVNSMSDLFVDGVPDAWIDQTFAVMAITRQHTYQLLTKRAARMRAYLSDPETPLRIGVALMESARGNLKLECTVIDLVHSWTVGGGWPLTNVWCGVSAEDQPRADERIPELLLTLAAVRFISAEPLIGAIDLARIPTFRFRGAELLNALTGRLSGMFGDDCATRLPGLDWVIAGGESGDGARPMQPEWTRQLRDACTAAGVDFFFKQWGEYAPTSDVNGPYMMHVGKKAAGRMLDGKVHDGRPEIRA